MPPRHGFGSEEGAGLAARLLPGRRHHRDGGRQQQPTGGEDDEATAVLEHRRSLSSASSSAAAEGGRPGGTGWFLTAMVCLGEMLGIGVLSMPSVFVRLGYVPALLFICLFGAFTWYSGSLYARLMAGRPRIKTLDQLAQATVGRAGRVVVALTVYTDILLAPVIMHVTAVEALRQVRGAAVAAAVQPILLAARTLRKPATTL